MSSRPRVLFLCIGNACRSPMGEGFLRHLGGDRFEASSAGIQPIGVQPETVSVMSEVGVDISDLRSSFVHHALREPPDHLIALSKTALQSCPQIPESVQVHLWPVRDPYTVRGGQAARMVVFRSSRDEILERVERWLSEN